MTVVGKFAKRKFSDDRLDKLALLEGGLDEKLRREKEGSPDDPFVPATYRDYVQPIFDAAEGILDTINPDNTKLIFIGQRMRPLFEAVRAINEVRRRFKRRDVVYVVTPKSPDHLYDGHEEKKEMYPLHIARNVIPVLNSKGFSKGTPNVYIFDWELFGIQREGIEKAVLELNPKANITQINQHSEVFGEGIGKSEDIDVPTSKDYFGKIGDGIDQERKDKYLLFQKALQEYISKLESK